MEIGIFTYKKKKKIRELRAQIFETEVSVNYTFYIF